MDAFQILATPAALIILERASVDLNAEYSRVREKIIEPASARYIRIIIERHGCSRDKALASIADSKNPDESLNDFVRRRLDVYKFWRSMCVAAVQYEQVRAELGLEGVLWFRNKYAGRSRREAHDLLLHFLSIAKPDLSLQQTLRIYRKTFGGTLIAVPQRKSPGRKPIGSRPMTAAERQRRHREKKLEVVGMSDNAR